MSKSQSERNKRRIAAGKKKWNRRRTQLFVFLLSAFCVAGCLIPLRPTRSESEKRDLAAFPKITLAGVWDGSFFRDFSLWYGDTFPGREDMIHTQSQLKELYGLRRQEIHGTASKGDEIPEIGTRPAGQNVISGIPGGEPAGNTSGQDANAPGQDGSTPGQANAPGQNGSTSGQGNAAGGSGLPGDPSTAQADPSKAGQETTAEALPETPETTQAQGDGTIFEIEEEVGSLYIANHRAFEIYGFSRAGAEAYASMLNTVKQMLGEGVQVYDLVVPSSFGVCLSEEVQEELGASDQRSAIRYTHSLIDTSVHVVDLMDLLVSHNAEYIYFNTDHHWTTLGAYYAYQQFCREKGITAHSLDQFETMEFPGFLGTYYYEAEQPRSLAENPDTVTAYIPMGTNEETYYDENWQEYHWYVVSDVSDYSAGNKYSCFIGGDNPLTEIHNPAIQDGSACLVIKESYGNAFVPFLVDHYQHIYVVDYRYYKGESLSTFAPAHGVTDVIYLNYVDAILESRSEKMLALWQ